ncbi:sensor histidine kinase [Streptomyces adelaidensis]|uniref:sensor histidine kinase n=1 Tax=Streptomyces adelaidensis TaxID=2796465 RepID=UPI00190408FC|nr:histidine kinase [Streptomyces adelaidensis]
MTTEREPGAAGHLPAAPEPLSPPLGLEAAWAHPLVGRLLRAQRLLRRTDGRHPWLLDSLIVSLAATVALLDALLGRDKGPFGAVTGRTDLSLGLLLAVTVVLVLPLWWRRRAPTVVFALVAVGACVPWVLDLWVLAGVSLLVALHNVALRGSLRVLGWAAAVTCAQMSVAVWFLLSADDPWAALVMLLSQETAAIALGLTLRTRRIYLAALEDRAARLEIERDQRERLIAAAERSRVAREMHDIVGHNLAVMVGLADGAATLAASQGEHAAEPLRIIGDTGRQAMGELRRVLGVLGSKPDDAPLGPQPGLADLDTLLARVRAAGVSVSYRTEGDLCALGSGVELTVYRIVQESLTNTLKHAGTDAAAQVTVAAGPDGIRVRITDTGPPLGPRHGPTESDENTSGGHGLVGIRQRSEMYGGTVTAGPRGDGPGWIVDVTLEAPSTPLPTPGDQAP